MPVSSSASPAAPIRCAGQCDHTALKTVLFAIIHVVLFVCAFPPVNAWPLVVLAPAPLAWLAINAKTTRRALFVVLVAQCAMWLWLDRWMVDVTMAGYLIKSLYTSLYALLFTWIVRRIARGDRLARLPMALVVPIVWTACECLRGEFVFHGYPWFLLANPLVEQPLLVQSADLLGTYFVSFQAALAAGAAVDLMRVHAGQFRRRTAIRAVAGVVVLAGINAGYGAWRMGQRDVLEPGPRILAIQTNLPQNNKIAWTVDQQRRDLAVFLALTRQAFAETGGDADLVVWPETMLPVHGLEVEALEVVRRWGQTHEIDFATGVAQLRDDLGTSLLIGSPCFVGLGVDESGERPRFTWDQKYNSAYLIPAGGGLQRYDKVFLTPFGEVMPYISAWPWLEEQLLVIGAKGMSFSLDAAETIRTIDLRTRAGETVPIATPICFEDVIPRLCRQMVYADGRKRVEVLVNLSNDGWFGQHDAGRVQHAQVARMRCVENRVPMIRCVNTGVSVAVDSLGNLAGQLGDDRYGVGRRAGWMEADVVIDRRVTLYGRLGEVWPWTCVIVTTGLVLGTVRRRSSRDLPRDQPRDQPQRQDGEGDLGAKRDNE